MGPAMLGVALFIAGLFLGGFRANRHLERENRQLRRVIDALLHEVRVLNQAEVSRTMRKLRRQIRMN